MATTNTPDELDQRIENILHTKLSHFLTDIDFRINQAYDIVDRATTQGSAVQGKVYAEDLNLIGRHMITGYTITPNSPGAGSVAWANLHMVYNGTNYDITDGNTALKYIWWSSTTTPTVLQTSNTKPVLQTGEVLLFMNIVGTPKVMLSDTNASMPQILSDGAVDTGSILANAVGSTQINANAITSAKLADGAIARTGQLAANTIGTSAILANAVTGNEILAGSVSATKLSILRHVLY
jgi:hypothetical protein